MPGPLPAAQHQRERNTKRRDADTSVVTDDGLLRGEPLSGVFAPETVEWFEGWRRAPQAALFASTDWARLRLLAPLVDAYFRRPNAAGAAEIRMNEEKLGALYGDRLRARIRIERPDVAPAVGNVTPISVASRADAKARLRGDS